MAFCLFYLATNYVLGSLIVAGVIEQFTIRDAESRRLQRRAAIRKLHDAQAWHPVLTLPLNAGLCHPDADGQPIAVRKLALPIFTEINLLHASVLLLL